MNISIEERPELTETQVVIRCPKLDGEVRALLARLQSTETRLIGARKGESRVLDPGEVLYIDTVDRSTFLYTADGVYETPLRLYELEERLAGRDFLRVGKSTIINFDAVRALRPDFGGRMRLTLSNGEVVMASRQYVPTIKAKLGL